MRSSRRNAFLGTGDGRLSSLLAVCAAVALVGSGCVTTNEVARSAKNDPEYIEKLDNLSRVFETRDVEKLIGLYAQDTYSLSFDQQWAFNSGATDHRSLLLNLLSNLESLKIEWAPDAEVDRTTERVWTTRHFTANAVSKSGKETAITGWHSAIWEKRGEAVVIAYEHVSLDPKTVERALPPPPVVVPAPAPAAVAEAETFPDIFFDYDLWNIRTDQLESIGIVLAWLEKYPEATMTIEGHCDERGSSGYNIRLGERRAASTKAWLVGKGIAADRLQTISFGKSRPFEEGRSQGAWQSNRRSHFVVTKGPQRAE